MEAVRLANGTPYGLGASAWGTDPESLDAVARRRDGLINQPSVGKRFGSLIGLAR